MAEAALKPTSTAKRYSSEAALNARRVTITAPARLHCGLLNTSGSFGRIDGGIGFAIEEPCWHVEACFAEGADDVLRDERPTEREHAEAVALVIDRLSRLLGNRTISIRIKREIPIHAGLGSKTALMLAVARAIVELVQADLEDDEIARIVGRGGTSGVGIHAFSRGGAIWDAGHGYPDDKAEFAPSSAASAPPPKLIGAFDASWLKAVVFRFSRQGPSGVIEAQAFRAECPTSEADTTAALVAASCYIAPGLVERNEHRLQLGLAQLQRVGFKKIEWERQDEVTLRFRSFWNLLGQREALSLSSFGPSLFVLTSRPRDVCAAIEGFPTKPLSLHVTDIRQRGAEVHV